MAHSHLPTWKPAKASASTFNVGSQQVSAQALPGFTKLKFRHPEQEGAERNESLEELERRENAVTVKHDNKSDLEKDKDKDKDNDKEKKGGVLGDDLDQFDDRDDDVSDSGSDGDDKSNRDDESSDDDDEEEEIARELMRIRKEREEKARLEEKEAEELAAKALLSEAGNSNPLLNRGGDSGGGIKRRWDADVVFQNQARDEDAKKKKRFINDTIRNDFHRNFLKRYIK